MILATSLLNVRLQRDRRARDIADKEVSLHKAEKLFTPLPFPLGWEEQSLLCSWVNVKGEQFVIRCMQIMRMVKQWAGAEQDKSYRYGARDGSVLCPALYAAHGMVYG